VTERRREVPGGSVVYCSRAEPRTGHQRLVAAVAAIACCGAGLALAGHHPLWPIALTAAFAAWIVAAARWPRLWLFALPAAMPILNFSPWTGWLIFDEFDLLVLGVLAGGFASRALALNGVHPSSGDARPAAVSRVRNDGRPEARLRGRATADSRDHPRSP